VRVEKISLPLWVTAPVESMRTRLLMFRTGTTNAHQARIAVGVHAAAREALRLALPARRLARARSGRGVRKVINRQLRAGSLPPAAILRPLGWTAEGVLPRDTRPEAILHGVLYGVLRPAPAPAVSSEGLPAPAPVSDLGQNTGVVGEGVAPAAVVSLPALAVIDLTTVPAAVDLTGPAPDRPDRLSGPGAVSEPVRTSPIGGRVEEGPDPRPGPPATGSIPLFSDTTASDMTASAPLAAAPVPPVDSGPGRVLTQQQRLAHAVQIVHRYPAITGPELQAELDRAGWPVSGRTATRILAEARHTQTDGRRLSAVRN
jgi:hypothetical protein